MGSEGSKIRQTKSTTKKKLSANASPKHIIPPTIKVINSVSCNDNLLNVAMFNSMIDFGMQSGHSSSRCSLDLDINRSRSESMCSSRSTSKQKHPIPIRNRQLIQTCFQNPHEILGHKILKRVYEKRNDFAKFYSKLSSDQRDDIEEEVKLLLKKTVANINFIDEIQRLAEEFGSKHVKFRAFGFKPDFFGAYADATITECTFLDSAVYSSVRDGFYAEMRRMRRASNSFSTGSNSSSYVKKILLSDADISTRSGSSDNDSEGSDFSSPVVITVNGYSMLKPSAPNH
ncbi:unnamed protein product [Thelazia callipaeda]|uniref:Akirin n=1 Tax=Thelazia callipaeda TaxID=103827 RepID=A0A158RC17_THECL|nr:unnamed protein product [Thelazia callipaeda]